MLDTATEIKLPTLNAPEAIVIPSERKPIQPSELPENVRQHVGWLINEPEEAWKMGEMYIVRYHLTDGAELLVPGQDISVEVAINPNKIDGKSINGCMIVPFVGGQPMDLMAMGRMDMNTSIDINWGGGFESDRPDDVVVSPEGEYLLRIKKIRNTEDLVAYVHEASHTLQPAEIVKATDKETNGVKKSFYSKALEKDAWENTEQTLSQMGVQIDESNYKILTEHFKSIYSGQYKVACSNRTNTGDIFDALMAFPEPKINELDQAYQSFSQKVV